MKPSITKYFKAFGLIAIGMVTATAGIYVGETDDAPGAALIGILVLIAMIVLGVRIMRRKT